MSILTIFGVRDSKEKLIFQCWQTWQSRQTCRKIRVCVYIYILKMKMQKKTFYTLLWTHGVCFNIVNRFEHTWGIRNPHVDVDSIPNQHANPLCHPLDMTLESIKDTKWNISMIPGKKSREQVPNGMKGNKILSWIDQFEVFQLSGSPWNGWLNQKVSYPLSHYSLLLGQGASTHWKVAKFNMADLPPSPILSVPRWMQSRSKCILLLTIPSTSILIIPENQLVTANFHCFALHTATPMHLETLASSKQSGQAISLESRAGASTIFKVSTKKSNQKLYWSPQLLWYFILTRNTNKNKTPNIFGVQQIMLNLYKCSYIVLYLQEKRAYSKYMSCMRIYIFKKKCIYIYVTYILYIYYPYKIHVHLPSFSMDPSNHPTSARRAAAALSASPARSRRRRSFRNNRWWNHRFFLKKIYPTKTHPLRWKNEKCVCIHKM